MVDLTDPRLVNAYDELPLWSAMFGLLLLDEVPLAAAKRVLDAGCGTGFPLIELAERLGADAEVHGVDIWHMGLERARQKIAARGTRNVTMHECRAASMPFDDGTFDLIVSNLGVNNFDDRDAALRECRRVARDGATIALTTNLQGHMRELYEAMEPLLDADGLRRLDEHVAHRATVASVRALLERNGFHLQRVVERTGFMRFASGSALFAHHFIKLGFVDAWKDVLQGREDELIARLPGELRLTIPMAYVEATAI
jgi:arsenite methyltransferase